MKFASSGTGYVSMSTAKFEHLSQWKTPLSTRIPRQPIGRKLLNLRCTLDKEESTPEGDFVIIAAFSVEEIIAEIVRERLNSVERSELIKHYGDK